MLKFMICSNPDKLSDQLLQGFRDFILRTEIVQVDTASSNADAFAEARRRVQAAGKAAMTDVKYGGGDGTSYETAITIQNVANGFGCVSAQYAWLDAHMQGCQTGPHSSAERQDREYSILQIECDGEEMELYFDITDCEKRK